MSCEKVSDKTDIRFEFSVKQLRISTLVKIDFGYVLNNSLNTRGTFETILDWFPICFGKHLGTSFQLIDDALDYMSDVSRLGKNIGDDLAEGKPTLPLLYAMWNGNENQTKLIENAICNGGLDHLDKIIKTIEDTGGLSYTLSLAEKEAGKAYKALANLSSSVYKEDLERLIGFTVNRSW